jgi:hypothetical protein
MGKIYNIVLMSSQGTGTIASRQFYFDFSKLPAGEYTGNFSFVSASGTFTTSCCNIFCDLGQGTTYSALTTSGVALSTSTYYLGSAVASPVGTSWYMCASLPNNPPFTLFNKPPNNSITVKILNNDSNQSAFATELAYTLVLSLELKE